MNLPKKKKKSQQLNVFGKQTEHRLTLPSALIVTSEILKVTFGFAVPIKTDVNSQALIVCCVLLWCYSYRTGKGKQQNAL